MWVWRPIMRQMVSFEAVKSGLASVEDIMKLNALIDMTDYLNDPEET